MTVSPTASWNANETHTRKEGEQKHPRREGPKAARVGEHRQADLHIQSWRRSVILAGMQCVGGVCTGQTCVWCASCMRDVGGRRECVWGGGGGAIGQPRAVAKS